MKQFLLFASFFIILSAFGQNDTTKKDDIRTLFTKNESRRFAVSPELKLSQVNNELGMLAGLKLNAFSKKNFSSGIAGYGLVTNHKFRSKDQYGNDTDLKVGLWYAGLLFEFTLLPDEIVHFTFPVLLGGGMLNISIYEKDEFQKHYYNHDVFTVEKSPFLIIEPGMNMELSLAKHLKLALGLSYR